MTCTAVKINVSIGNAGSTLPGHELILRIRYEEDGITEYITTTKTAGSFDGSLDWVELTGLDLPPNDYYLTIFSNSSSLSPYLFLRKELTPADPDYYSEGYAASGWSGETTIGDRVDFEAEITLVDDTSTTRTIDVLDEGTQLHTVGSISGQWITVPAGWTLSEAKINVDIGNAAATFPGHEVIFRIKYYEGGTAKYITTTKTAENFDSTLDWVELTGLNLPANDYYLSIFSNSSSLSPYLSLRKELTPADPDYYADGYAASGWSGETPVGDRVILRWNSPSCPRRRINNHQVISVLRNTYVFSFEHLFRIV